MNGPQEEATMAYGDMNSRLQATHLTMAVVIWEDAESGVTWALGLDATSTKVTPQLRNHAWRCLGVLPPGIPVDDLGNQRETDFVPCRVASVEVRCSVSALQ